MGLRYDKMGRGVGVVKADCEVTTTLLENDGSKLQFLFSARSTRKSMLRPTRQTNLEILL
jgi:hypothetical protein